ncbi:hypothetical protein BpHYR1_045313 [Brachionus plicatilis]|uniref:Uncharacterized protein n=1 Tax=Brachionus plicatilis TaxID=10195 RepID=A0A3M7SSH5_BRAPC|nr:hypothetical protein BpHYR1_045313 [Brachionus plicatilis]
MNEPFNRLALCGRQTGRGWKLQNLIIEKESLGATVRNNCFITFFYNQQNVDKKKFSVMLAILQVEE